MMQASVTVANIVVRFILPSPLRINNHTLGRKHPRVNTKSQAIKSPAEAGLGFKLLAETLEYQSLRAVRGFLPLFLELRGQ